MFTLKLGSHLHPYDIHYWFSFHSYLQLTANVKLTVGYEWNLQKQECSEIQMWKSLALPQKPPKNVIRFSETQGPQMGIKN